MIWDAIKDGVIKYILRIMLVVKKKNAFKHQRVKPCSIEVSHLVALRTLWCRLCVC